VQTPDPDVALVRYGEIGIKSGEVRSKMLHRLAENVGAILADRGLDGEVETRWERILLRGDDVDALARAASDAFGVVSTRPAVTVAPDAEAIEEAAVGLAADHPTGATFAVRAHRTGPTDAHPFTSQGIERTVGGAVDAAVDGSVDLDAPDVTYRLEVREQEAFVSAVEYDGPGGLPAGTQGKVVVLFSGGIDSPVAAWELLKRGLEPVPVYVDLGDYGGPDHLARAEETTRQVGRYAPHLDTRLRVVPAGDLVRDLAAATGSTRMLSLRRAMLRMAEAVARDVGAHSIATGESVGQKSSQTGANLHVTDAATAYPVHRPLLTRDKPDIVEQARRIGTFSDATMNVGCERVAPDHPETNATIAGVEEAEPEDLLSRAEAVAADRTVVDADPTSAGSSDDPWPTGDHNRH
jgi:thiamine biosynthesis protein ThiI